MRAWGLSIAATELRGRRLGEVGDIASEALLWQAGYLTIHRVEEVNPGQWTYTLGYPNREVEISLNASLINGYGGEDASAFEARNVVGLEVREA
ncbi:MAG: hypothetical protein VKP62_10920 [Candidatus Sericytochromatia bacterium]|nr:hypothetical protein [Candidatus Sericytochromatia bacterium]